MGRWVRAAAAATAAVLVCAAACGNASVLTLAGSHARSQAAEGSPNVVFILVDDMSMNLLQYMPNTKSMVQDRGVTFTNFITSNSLCCPSRGTIMTGKYPHNSRIRANSWPAGGFGAFCKFNLTTSLGADLKAAPSTYRTAFLGKFLNEYTFKGNPPSGPNVCKHASHTDAPHYPPNYVPPGWDKWYVPGDAYGEFNYFAVHDTPSGKAETDHNKHDKERNYFTDVVKNRAVDFINASAQDPEHRPFFLELSTFGVHSGNSEGDLQGKLFPAAPRDRPRVSGEQPSDWLPAEYADGDCGDPAVAGGCPSVVFPDPGSVPTFGQVPANSPRWMDRSTVTDPDVAMLRSFYLERIQMLQSIDDMVGRVVRELRQNLLLRQTYIVFTTDNGFHLGEHALLYGKSTAFDHDVRLPLIIRPPSGVAAPDVSALVQTTDLLPTFLDIAQLAIPDGLDGRSVKPFLDGEPPADWRTGTLIEHLKEDPNETVTGIPDPDLEPDATRPPTYKALRTADYLYVDYSPLDEGIPVRRQAEIYDLRNDPYETTNLYPLYKRALASTDRQFLETLNIALKAYEKCEGVTCQTFQAPPFVPPSGTR